MARKKSKPAKAEKPVDEEDDVPMPKLRRARPDDAEDEPKEPKVRSNVFTGLAALSLLALIGSAVFFHLDHEETLLKSLAAPAITVPSAATVPDAPPPKGRLN